MRELGKGLLTELMRRFLMKEGANMNGKAIVGLAVVGLVALLAFVGYRLLVVELIANLHR
jgi:hypothetical protein